MAGVALVSFRLWLTRIDEPFFLMALNALSARNHRERRRGNRQPGLPVSLLPLRDEMR
jgi:hypothetical protein